MDVRGIPVDVVKLVTLHIRERTKRKRGSVMRGKRRCICCERLFIKEDIGRPCEDCKIEVCEECAEQCVLIVGDYKCSHKLGKSKECNQRVEKIEWMEEWEEKRRRNRERKQNKERKRQKRENTGNTGNTGDTGNTGNTGNKTLIRTVVQVTDKKGKAEQVYRLEQATVGKWLAGKAQEGENKFHKDFFYCKGCEQYEPKYTKRKKRECVKCKEESCEPRKCTECKETLCEECFKGQGIQGVCGECTDKIEEEYKEESEN
jgi:hypothetical protein